MVNTWYNGKTRVISPIRPGKDYWPEISMKRVLGRHWVLIYKSGSEEWRRAANDALYAAADRMQYPQPW